MALPLLETKLRAPRPRRDQVPRPRLAERLDRGAEAALTLVSAPAGFGKTTLLAAWAGARPTTTAWLSLDPRDNDPTTFWTYLVAALRAAGLPVGADALALLESPRPPIEAVLASLLNDLGGVGDDVVLVLDDHHVVESRDVHDGVAFLLEHVPPQLHLVIAGRADPPLPLARLRGRGELVEVRAADLRFTGDEAAAYLDGAVGTELTAQDVAALETRTEGWIAALQLAALSMQGRADVAGFVAGFAGDDRYIVDYLAEEVLARQPDAVRDFLLRTSVLDRLTGSLCDAVTGQDGGRARLAELERANLFLAPLDDRRAWYRYHRLFADVLAARLHDERPGEVPELYRRASAWFERGAELPEAIRYALAAGDVERTADLVEAAIPDMRRTRREAAVHAWLEALPDGLVRSRPVLAVARAGAGLSLGRLDDVEERLREVEPRLRGGDPDDDPEVRRLPSMIELYRAALALARGDVPGTVSHAERALDRAPGDDHLARAAAAGLTGLASWTSGDLDGGHRAYTACLEGLRRAGYVADTFGCAIALADIRITQGRLGDALHTYEETLRRAAEHGGPPLRGAADMDVGTSEILRERDDVAGARKLLLRSQELGEHAGLPQNPYRWRVAMARVREAEGDPAGALALLDAAQRVYVGDFFPEVRPIAAIRARVWITQGRLDEARGWARERGLTAHDELGYLREFEHVTLARLLLAEGSVDDTTLLLERLLRAAEDGARTGSVVEILLLQALARGPRRGAGALQRALGLAEPEGYVRIFADEGAPVAALLRSAGNSPYVRRLLAATGRDGEQPPAAPGLIEPLSERELDVLRLLGTDLGGPDIARTLVVSLNTVRTHTSHIYAKLGVTNRRAAVRRAAELDLLSRQHR
jgi:LuxR family transcriptional regulator, maltose regulon positive regulatory protein